jgi:hypothetical protein
MTELQFTSLKEHSPKLSGLSEPTIEVKVDKYIRAVSIDGNNIKYIPKLELTTAIVETAFKNMSSAAEIESCLACIPKDLVSNEVFSKCLFNNPSLLNIAPEVCITEDVCKRALVANAALVTYVPKKYFSIDFFNYVMSRNPNIFTAIPDEYKTEAMCLDAVRSSKGMFQYVPPPLRNYEVCKTLLAVHGQSFDLITALPLDILTKFVEDKIVKPDLYTYKFWPMSGAVFNILYGHMNFYKLTTQSENHNGFVFRDGTNTDTKPFDPKGSCQPGGIYFTDHASFNKWTSYGNKSMYWYRSVTVPYYAKVYIEDDNKLKADTIILGARTRIQY